MSTNKGISDIITIIIILLVAVSLAGGFFLWAGRSVETLQEGAGAQINESTVSLGQKLRIESADGTNNRLSIRNIGSAPVDHNSILITVDGARRTCSSWSSGTGQIVTNQVDQCIGGGGLPEFECTIGQEVRITSAGGEDNGVCITP